MKYFFKKAKIFILIFKGLGKINLWKAKIFRAFIKRGIKSLIELRFMLYKLVRHIFCHTMVVFVSLLPCL